MATSDHTGSSDSDVAALSDLEDDAGDDEEEKDGLPFPGFIPYSLKYLDQNTRPRSWCLIMITNPWFERVSMLVILLNCVTLGMYQPCEEGNCESSRCQILQVFDDFIFAFFTLEMTVKMIAMGVYGKGTYLADPWNVLDFVIVLCGALEYFLNVENKNVSAVRTIRVLRPLRAINRIPSMRILVMLLLDTLPMLGNVLLLCFFVFFIFGIAGVQLWQGVLRQRCILRPNITYPKEIENRSIYVIRSRYNSGMSLYYQDQDKDYICSRPDDNGMHTCADLPPLREGDLMCNASAEQYGSTTNRSCVNWNQYYTVCDSIGHNPFQGTISFDNIGQAWVAIFLVISLEGWTDIMYYVQDAHSFWDWIYFVLLIVIGSFFMINLCLVVIATQFSETKKREMERMRLERARFHSSSTLASSTNNSEPTSCYAEIVKYVAHLWRRTKRRLMKKYRLFKYRRQRVQRDGKLLPHHNHGVLMTSTATTIPHSFSMQYCGGNDGPGPPNYHHHHHHYPQHTHHHYSRLCHTCPHSHHTCRHHQCAHHRNTSSRLLSDNPDELSSPPQIAEGSNKDEELLRVASSGCLWIDMAHDANASTPLLLNSPSLNGQRGRGSVMFSDEVTLVSSSEHKNVCSSEKMTQTIEGDIWPSMPDKKQTIKEQPLSDISTEAMTCQELLAFSGALSAALPTGQSALESLFSSLSKGIVSRGDRWPEMEMCSFCGELVPISCQRCALCIEDEKREKHGGTDLKEIGGCLTRCCLCFCRELRRFIKAVVEHKYFQQGILLAILFNTLSMGIEYHKQPETLTTIVEISNIVFSAIFAVEMVLKVVAEGPFGYISNGFNVFDGIIVILSIVELCQTFLGSETVDRGGGSGLSVLRTFRLLRILKLVRFMPNLRRQLFVMLRTMDNVAVFFSLLMLFIFIFSVLGMYLFGGKFCMLADGTRECTCHEIVSKRPDCICDRKHFNNFLWATVTVFQILTQEDWNVVLFNGMEKTSHWASLYFVALMTFGNYVLFNLLVAILVEGFSSERNERREREARELEKQREKAAEIAAALFEEVSIGTEDSGPNAVEFSGKWRSAEDIHQAKFKRSKLNELSKSKDVWNIRQNLTEPDSKCNNKIKESKILLGSQSPPQIIHTAATPQDSPNTVTAEASFKEFSSKSPSPLLAFHSSTLSIDSIDRSSSSSIPGLLKPPTSSKNTNLANTQSSDVTKDNISTPRRVGSWRISRPSLRKKTRRASESEEEVILNNNNHHLNVSKCVDRGVCHSIRNDTQNSGSEKPEPSPQNSIHSRRSSYSIFVPQNTWGDNCKRYNTEVAPVANRNLGQTVQHDDGPNLKTVNLTPSPVSTNGIKSNNVAIESTLINPESGRDNFETKRRESIKKIFIFFRPPKALLERDHCSLYLLPPENRFRQFCIWVVERRWFDNVVLIFIGLNCITLAMERPNIPPDSAERLFLQYANYIFTVVFALEMFVKVVATGMIYGENAYFTSGWNIMDGSLVIISIVDLLMSLLSENSPRIFGILRVFRLLRSLRPLRVINRAPGLKLVVQTLLSSLRPIGNIVLICCTFFIIFGILGVQLFKGSFYYCDGPNLENVTTRADCENDKRNKWLNRKYNFDDLGQALMSLFVLSSRDGWVNIMYTGLDAVGVDLQPIKNYSEWRLLYFISFILLVGFFVLNMFVGVVVENFHRCREEQEKEERMLRLAKRAKQMEKKRRKLHEPPYYIGYSKPRLFVHNVVTSKYFDLAIAGVIGLNVVTMAGEFYKMPNSLIYALKIFNYFFTAVFILELLMKLYALGFILYLKDKWNQLDVVIVFLSVVGIVLEEVKSKIIPINPTIIRVMRVLRIARVLKLLKMAKGIRALLDTVMQALPQVGNLGLLFFLLFFIFAALGVELFGRLECSEELPCQGLGEHAHFSNFGMAFLTLFRVATGDNWNGIMKDTLREECDKSQDCVRNCCVSTIIAPIFFVIFVLMAQFVLVNVVVAVLMKHLEESHKQMEDELDMEVELERELQQEQDELEDEMCLQQALDPQIPVKRPLGKVLSLPANFTYSSGSAKDDETKSSYQSTNKPMARRQTFHSHSPSSFSKIYTTEQDRRKNSEEQQKRIDSLLVRRKSLKSEFIRRASVSAGNSRRGSLLRPRAEFQNLFEISKSVGLVPTPQQLLSLTELVVDEKEREKRILRKALSMETRTASDETTEFVRKSPEAEKLQRLLSDRRSSFRTQKSTEAMEKIEEDVSVSPRWRKKGMLRQLSLSSEGSQKPQRFLIKRQLTCPASERNIKIQKRGLTRQEQVISTESLTEPEVQLSLIGSSLKSSIEETETAETSLVTEKPKKDSKYLGASMETGSTSSNSTNVTNLRSDSVVSEDGKAEEIPTSCVVIVEEIIDVETNEDANK